MKRLDTGFENLSIDQFHDLLDLFFDEAESFFREKSRAKTSEEITTLENNLSEFMDRWKKQVNEANEVNQPPVIS